MIIDEAVNYILTLQTTLKNLQNHKLSFMADQAANNNSAGSNHAFSASDRLPVGMKTWTSSNVVLNICGNDAHFSVYAPKKAGHFTAICRVLDKYKLKETYVNVSSELDRYIYIIQANVSYLIVIYSLCPIRFTSKIYMVIFMKSIINEVGE